LAQATNKKANEEPLDLDVGDEMDIAQGITIEDMSKKLTQRNKAMLSRIHIALDKIENGYFGECEECSEEILEARLKAVPDCRLCINCAEQEEKIRKQYR
jgi:DnaK suppressor protein